MIYNMDFLISAMVILLLILWHFLGQKRAEDLNNRVFLFFAVLGTADVVAEFFTNYYITSYNSDMENAAVIVTTIFYLLQALLPVTFIFYIQTLHEQKIISAKKMFISGVPTLVLISVILTNPFTEKLFSCDSGICERAMVSADVCQCVGAFCSGIIAYSTLAQKAWASKRKNTFGDFCDIRCRCGLADVLSVTFDDWIWNESWYIGIVHYDQQSKCQSGQSNRLI